MHHKNSRAVTALCSIQFVLNGVIPVTRNNFEVKNILYFILDQFTVTWVFCFSEEQHIYSSQSDISEANQSSQKNTKHSH